MRPSFELVSLVNGQRLSQSGEPILEAYFPCSGMISLVQPLDDGGMVEVGLVGREGFWGAPLVMGIRTSPVEAMVQGEGTALRISERALSTAVNASQELRNRLLRYAQFLYVQVSLTAACNARHNVKQRLARWLLEAQARLGGDDIPLSHEFLSFMLGIRRAGVTAALGSLKIAGLINTRRGRIEIRDRRALKQVVCECHGIVEAEYKRVMTP